MILGFMKHFRSREFYKENDKLCKILHIYYFLKYNRLSLFCFEYFEKPKMPS